MVPDLQELWGALGSFATRAGDELSYVVNRLNTLALLMPTTKYGYKVVEDLENTLKIVRYKVIDEGDLPLFYDILSTIVYEIRINVKEINEWLLKYKIGYAIYYTGSKYYWHVRDDIENLTEKIDETLSVIKTDFEQANEHLLQAKKQLENASNERARKDAVRDCLSAMESITKILGGADEIGDATKNLKESNKWELNEIVKDGNSIFNTLHRLHPDLRHGTNKKSSMSKNEAKYWMDRITVFIDYILRQKKEIDG